MVLRPFDAFLIPFSLIWAGVPTAVFIANIASGKFGASSLFFLVFVIPGQYITWGRFVVDRGVRKGMYYAVTDTRCMIVGTRWRRITRTYARGRGDYELVEHRNGRGTIRFVTGSWTASRRNPWGEWFSSFEQIPDAPAVYRLVRTSATADHARPVDVSHRQPHRPEGLGSPSR